MDESDLKKLFEDDNMVKNYKIGEKVTGQFAQSLLEQSSMIEDANATPEKPLVVLDNACGTGVVSSLLIQQLNEDVKKNWQLTCGDLSKSMLDFARRRLQREGCQNAIIKVVDAQDTGLPSAHYTHAITAFGKLTCQRVCYLCSF
jgi:ubiquinone/menaquinone biosynthesis C-methylase UbiE